MPTFSLRVLLLAVSLILPLAVAQAASLDGLSEATPTELPERWHEEGARGGIGGKTQLRDNCGNMCRGVIGSKDVFLAGSSRKHREN